MAGMASALPAFDPKVFAGFIAVAHTEADDNAKATRLLEEFAAADFELPQGATWLVAMLAYADAAAAVGDAKYAVALFDRLAPFADQWGYSGSTFAGPVCFHLGRLAAVLGRYDEAGDYFARSAESCAAGNVKFYAARTNLSWGQMLAEHGGFTLDYRFDLARKAFRHVAAYDTAIFSYLSGMQADGTVFPEAVAGGQPHFVYSVGNHQGAQSVGRDDVNQCLWQCYLRRACHRLFGSAGGMWHSYRTLHAEQFTDRCSHRSGDGGTDLSARASR